MFGEENPHQSSQNVNFDIVAVNFLAKGVDVDSTFFKVGPELSMGFKGSQ